MIWGSCSIRMLTGQRPYGGRSAVAIMSQHASALCPFCPRPRQRNTPLDRLMAKQQNARYAICRRIARRLRTLGGGCRLRACLKVTSSQALVIGAASAAR